MEARTEPEPLVPLLTAAFFRFVLAWLSFAFGGALLCYATLLYMAPALTQALGHDAVASSSFFEVLALLFEAVVHPATWVIGAWLVGFPLIFLVVGYPVGVRVAVARLVQGRGLQLSGWLARLLWPSLQVLKRTPGRGAFASLLTSSLERAGESRPLYRWAFGQLLSVLKVREVLLADSYLTEVDTDPEGARGRLGGLIFSQLARVSEANGASVFLIMGGALVLVSLLHVFWFPWVGIIP